MADRSRRTVPWAQAYYQAHRQKGQSHACVIRCLGQRWIKIIFKMWQSRTTYNPDPRQRNQIKQGSWVVALQPTTQQ